MKSSYITPTQDDLPHLFYCPSIVSDYQLSVLICDVCVCVLPNLKLMATLWLACLSLWHDFTTY